MYNMYNMNNMYANASNNILFLHVSYLWYEVYTPWE